MRLLQLVFCLCLLWYEAACSEAEFATKDDLNSLKGEIREIASTLSQFVEEVRGQLKVVGQGLATKEITLNDTTIEERVTILEFQVESLTVEVTDQGDEIDVIDGEVAAILTGQAIQDERILELEGESEGFEDSILVLDSTVSDIDNRLTIVNYTLDTRIAQMEVTGTVAFQADLDYYSSIPIDSVVIFDQVILNIGNGYDSATGEFSVPTSGAGLYYLYTNFFGNDQRTFHFVIRVNGGAICWAGADQNTSAEGDNGIATCGAVAILSEGDVVDVFYTAGTDEFPVRNNTYPYNTFTGFRIAPE